jgi:4-hydroxybutyryl-CoA dehydratase/vinylacetyl-CoA-Delta-isomerase
MKREIWRNYPVPEKQEVVAQLLDRGLVDRGERLVRQPGKCCALGCG